MTGQYVAYGNRGDYTYNKFLIEAYKAVGQEFNISSIEAERKVREDAKKAEKKAKKELEEKKKKATKNVA